MDSFDTVLEQLQQAQDRSRDAVSGRIDAVTDRLGQLVDEAAGVVREILSRETDELFPVAELRIALEEYHRRAATDADERSELARRLLEAEERIEGEAQSAPGLSLELLRNLDRARSQSELLRELLPALCSCAGRAAVLVIRGGDVSAWSGIGFSNGERLREWRCGTVDSPALARLVADERPVAFVAGQDPVFDGWLEEEAGAGDSLLVPVCLRGQLMGCVYLDDGGTGPWVPEAAQSMVAVACWMIDTLHGRQTVPTPMIAEVLQLSEELPETERTGEDQDVFAVVPPEPELEAAPEAAEEAVIEDEVPPLPDGEERVESIEQPAAAAEAPAEDLPTVGVEVEEDVEGISVEDDSGFDPSATMRVEVAPELEEPPPAVVEETAQEEVVVPAEPVSPPPPLEEPPPPVGYSPEQEAQHEEARRFARLLISEIKLYNEEEVERGRLARDIYPRLREDIDRSREMYEKRISEDIRRVTDYFDEELVRILAEGDPDALGM